MDEPYIHGSYIKQGRLALIIEAGAKLSVRIAEADDLNKNLTRDINILTQQAQHNLNEDVASGTQWLAENIGMEPYTLEYILGDVIGDLWTEDDYVRDTMSKLLVYVKMKEADRIAARVKELQEYANRITQENLEREAPALRSIKERYRKRIETAEADVANKHRDMTSYKEWFIERVNRAHAMAGKIEHMCDDDQKLIRRLDEKGLLGRDGPYTYINRDQIMFMDDVEFSRMIRDLLA
ncbi:hypothetical protein D3C87_737250 [compost metagenome]